MRADSGFWEWAFPLHTLHCSASFSFTVLFLKFKILPHVQHWLSFNYIFSCAPFSPFSTVCFLVHTMGTLVLWQHVSPVCLTASFPSVNLLSPPALWLSTTDEQCQGSTRLSLWFSVLCRTLFPAVLRPGVSVVLQAGDCTAVVITSVSVQLQSEGMQHFNEGNLPRLRSPRVSHD